jgi:hypothetical protein
MRFIGFETAFVTGKGSPVGGDVVTQSEMFHEDRDSPASPQVSDELARLTGELMNDGYNPIVLVGRNCDGAIRVFVRPGIDLQALVNGLAQQIAIKGAPFAFAQ